MIFKEESRIMKRYKVDLIDNLKNISIKLFILIFFIALKVSFK